MNGLLVFRENFKYSFFIQGDKSSFDEKEAYESITRPIIALKAFIDGPNKIWGSEGAGEVVADAINLISKIRSDVFEISDLNERLKLIGKVYEEAGKAMQALSDIWFKSEN